MTLDGSEGEGGGQILRSALALSMLTGQPFRIVNIRANRPKPGLMRQHLASVRAAAEICAAQVEGAELGATALAFAPGPVRPGTYRFAVGSAGSTTLVLQTVLVPLALAGAASHLVIEGGTHNSSAPHFDYLDRVFLPVIRRLGYRVEATLVQRGFYPAGGGAISVVIEPAGPRAALDLVSRGAPVSRRALAQVANLPYEIATREASTLQGLLELADAEAEAHTVKADGPGNIAFVTLAFEHISEIFTGFGTIGVTAEQIARTIVQDIGKYLKSDAAVGPHLADQLLLPMALAGGGRFTTTRPTPHTLTNIAVIRKFLPVQISVTDLSPATKRIDITSAGQS